MKPVPIVTCIYIARPCDSLRVVLCACTALRENITTLVQGLYRHQKSCTNEEAQHEPLDREGSGVGEKHGTGPAIYDSICDYGEEQAIQNCEYNRGRKVAGEGYAADGGGKRHEVRALCQYWSSRIGSGGGDISLDERNIKYQVAGVTQLRAGCTPLRYAALRWVA